MSCSNASVPEVTDSRHGGSVGSVRCTMPIPSVPISPYGAVNHPALVPYGMAPSLEELRLVTTETESTAFPVVQDSSWVELEKVARLAIMAHTNVGATHRGLPISQRTVPGSRHNLLYRQTQTASSWAAAPIEQDRSIEGRAATNDLSIAASSPMRRQLEGRWDPRPTLGGLAKG